MTRSVFVADRPLRMESDTTYVPFGLTTVAIVRDIVRSGFVAVLGPRRIGKTTLLNEVYSQWKTMGGDCRLIDLAQSVPSFNTNFSNTELSVHSIGFAQACWDTVLGVLSSSPRRKPCYDLGEFHRFLLRIIPNLAPQTLLILDHIDSLPLDLVRDLLITLRALYQELSNNEQATHLRILLAGSASLAQLTSGPTSPLLNIVRIHRINDLDETAAYNLLQRGLTKHGFVVNDEILAPAVDFFGGDRELLQRFGAQMVEEFHSNDLVTTISELHLHRLQNVIIKKVLNATGDWSLVKDFLNTLVRHPMIMDVAISLLEGKRPAQREFARDIGLVELSGFISISEGHYQFRTPFYEYLLQIFLTNRTLGDIKVFQHDWHDARRHYEIAFSKPESQKSWFEPNELYMALANCLLKNEEVNETLGTLAEILRLVFAFSEVCILQVKGRDSQYFVSIIGQRENDPSLHNQIEQTVSKKEKCIERIRRGQRWTLPITIRVSKVPEDFERAPEESYVLWVVVLYDYHGERDPRLLKEEQLVLFAQQLLSEKQRMVRHQKIAQITQSIAEARKEEVFERVVEAALKLTEANFGGILVPIASEYNIKKLRVAIQKNADGQYIDIEKTQIAQAGIPGCGVAGYAYSTQKPKIIGNKDTDSFQGYKFLPWIPEAVSEIAFPIIYEQQALGVIVVESEVPYFFHEGHKRVLEQLAHLAAIAMDNAQRLGRAHYEAILARTFGGIAHEVKTHSTAISFNAELVLDDVSESAEIADVGMVQALTVAKKHAREISQVVDDFRWLAHPTMHLVDRMDLRDVIHDAVTNLQERVSLACGEQIHSEQMEIILSDNSAFTVSGRAKLIRKVIENLLQNAVEAVKTIKPKIVPGDISLRLAHGSSNNYAIIEVLDRGPGIPQDVNIFEPYITTKKGKGLGLGLAICKQIIESHGGEIKAINRKDGGAVFHIEMPLIG